MNNNNQILEIMQRIASILIVSMCMAFSCVPSKNQSMENISVVEEINSDKDTAIAYSHIMTQDSCLRSRDTLGILVERITFRNNSYDVIVVDTRHMELSFFYKDSLHPQGFGSFDVLFKTRPNLRFLINGGMYTYENEAKESKIKPLGLYVENGKTITGIDTSKNRHGNFYMQPNGIFLLDKNMNAHVVTTEKYPLIKGDILHATQSGPMLLIDGKINKLFNENSINLNIRNGVGIVDAHTIIFAISNDRVNFFDFANLFKERYSCNNALYLDGAISGAVIPALARDDSKSPVKYAVIIGAEPKKKGEKQ